MSTDIQQETLQQRPRTTSGKGTSFGRALNSEFRKFSTVPSSVILVLTTLVVMVGIGALGAWVIGQTQDMVANDPNVAAAMGDQSEMANTIAPSGIMLAQLIIGSLGVLVMSSEFTTGMARATFAAIPKRFPVVLAKATLVALMSIVVTVVSTLVSAVVIIPILSSYSLHQDFASETFQRNLWFGAAYVAVIALLGMALGALLRNSAGAIVTLVAIVFILPTVFQFLTNDFFTNLKRFLPDSAYNNLITTTVPDGGLEHWQAGLTLGLWAVIPLLATLFVIQRRDV
ncbi:ABC transporter permease [Arthrobacter sp.]|uniref:ABC transporter permease n=1 Tax=Arthrobacter sp. TaxID=1667 RepID=UPI003A9131D6